jgi:hypothetical protein
MWKKLVKWAACKAFNWGLKKINELAPPEPEKRPVRVKKPRVN